MSASLVALSTHPGWGGPGPWHTGGPGWWIVFPILFWVLVVSAVGYLIYRGSPGRAARSAAERTLAERYATGDITAEELAERRTVLRRRHK
jgi:putative membrane protein